MKKFLILFLALTLLTFPACASEGADTAESETEAETLVPIHEKDTDTIDQALASEIKLAYCQAFQLSPESADTIYISSYIGNYSGCAVVYIGGNWDVTWGPITVDIAGYMIRGSHLHAYKNGSFYRLKEAYESGLLTKQDIYNIGKAVDPQFTERYPEP